MSIEGKKSGETRGWCTSSLEDYAKIDPECEQRTIAFIRRKAEAGTPFYAAYWPMMSGFIPSPEKTTVARTLLADGFTKVDAFLGKLMDELTELGIAENAVVTPTRRSISTRSRSTRWSTSTSKSRGTASTPTDPEQGAHPALR